MSVNRKISNLPAVVGASILDADILPLVASGVTSKTTIADIRVKLGFNVPAGGRTVTNPSTYFLNNAVFNVKDFGAYGDNSHDDAAAIQLAIDSCLTAGGGTVTFPIGDYKISTPLLAMKITGGVFVSISIALEALKTSWNGAGTNQKSARILPTFNNTFALGIQNARAVRVKDITIEGQNDFSGSLSGDLHELRTNATYVTGGARDSRYSPYSGIVIDPFGTSVPADGGYPGLTANYIASAGGSASMEFEGVKIRGFVTAFAIGINGTLALESEITWRDCKLEYNRVGVAIGQAQSRNLYWYGGSNVVALYGFDGNSYGAQTGSAPKIFGCNMSGKYLFNLPQLSGGVLEANGIHAESFYSIGFLGKTFATSRSPMKFTACEFVFGNFGSGPHADRHLYSLAPVHFDSCQFDTQGSFAPKVLRMVRDNAVPMRFTNCLFAREVQNEFSLAPSVNSGTVALDDLFFDSCILSNGGTRGPSSGNDRISNRYVVSAESLLNKHTMPDLAEIRLNSGANPGDRSWSSTTEGFNQVNHGSLAVAVNVDGTFSFTVPDGTIVRTGDLVYTTTAFNIEKYDGTTETMPALGIGIVTNVAGAVITADGAPQSLVNNNYTIITKWWPRYHQASVGDTHTNTTLDNVTNPTAWAVGNKVRGSGIPVGAYITAIVGSTFTLSKATTSTVGGTRLWDADIYKVTGTAV